MAQRVYQLRSCVDAADPGIWRSPWVPGTLTLAKLDRVIQAAAGWTNTHLHDFNIDGRRYRMTDDECQSGEQVPYPSPTPSTFHPPMFLVLAARYKSMYWWWYSAGLAEGVAGGVRVRRAAVDGRPLVADHLDQHNQRNWPRVNRLFRSWC